MQRTMKVRPLQISHGQGTTLQFPTRLSVLNTARLHHHHSQHVLRYVQMLVSPRVLAPMCMTPTVLLLQHLYAHAEQGTHVLSGMYRRVLAYIPLCSMYTWRQYVRHCVCVLSTRSDGTMCCSNKMFLCTKQWKISCCVQIISFVAHAVHY